MSSFSHFSDPLCYITAGYGCLEEQLECNNRPLHVDDPFEVKLKLSIRDNVLGNGSSIQFQPRGNPFLFQLDTHGWTWKVKQFGVWTVWQVCFPVVPLTLLGYNSYYEPPPPPQPQEALSFGRCCKIEEHSWHHRDPNNHNAVHWTRKCLLNQAGSLAVAKITHHCHLTGPGGAAGDAHDPPGTMEVPLSMWGFDLIWYL